MEGNWETRAHAPLLLFEIALVAAGSFAFHATLRYRSVTRRHPGGPLCGGAPRAGAGANRFTTGLRFIHVALRSRCPCSMQLADELPMLALVLHTTVRCQRARRST
jgi:hypothetical protein